MKTGMQTSALALALALPVVLLGCDKENPPAIDATTDSVEDGEDSVDDTADVEWGTQCEEDEQCDDRVDCTVDECQYGSCVNTPDDTLCDDELECNGDEVCHMRDDCVAGATFEGCYDGDPCTMDNCVEGAPGMAYTCIHPPLDRDGDDHVDSHCGGDDCNDLLPSVYPGAGELCFDEKDNDCDDLIDTDDLADCTLHNDTCEDPKEITLGGLTEGFNIEALGDITSGCDSSSYADVAFEFTLDSESDVEISIMGRDGFYPYGSLQTECGDSSTNLICKASSPFSACLPGLAADTYFLIVSSWDEGVFDIRVDATDPLGPLPGDDCDTAVDVSAGGVWAADLFCAAHDVTTSCASWATYNDLVYTFTIDEPQDVHIKAFSPVSYVYIQLGTECGGSTGSIDCDSDYPFDRTYGALPAGTYFIVLEAYTPTDYTLEVEFSAPSDPPDNDTCADAEDVSAGGNFPGSMISAADDGNISCRSGGYLDVAYTFTTTEVQDIDIDVNGHGGYEVYFALQTICGSSATDIGCIDSDPPRKLFRSVAPGTYYILVESSYEGEFDMDVTFSAPTSACDGAAIIDASGTVSGDTTSRPDDFWPQSGCSGGGEGYDIAYLLRLAEDSDVTIELTSGDFDSILYLREVCDDGSSQIDCDDDSGTGSFSLLDLPGLAAGDYYLIVDSYWSWDYGLYTLDVDITALGSDVADIPDVPDVAEVPDA